MNQFRLKREKSGMSQAAVAEYLGLHDKSTVSKWETTDVLPNARLLPQIAVLYSCTVDELLDKKEETA